MLTGLFIMFIMWFVARQGQTNFYPRSASHLDDPNLTIKDWASIPTELRQYFYILLHSYYSKESTSIRNISFRKSRVNKSALTKGILLAAGIFCTICSLGVVGCSLWMFFDFQFSTYLVSIFVFWNGMVILGLSVWILKTALLPRATIDTNELNIQYGITKTGISGAIIKLSEMGLATSI
eukprot:Phypoly_transcript_09231.p1 GENE.Phypoly_transcript_09231~~Phypoly_transcript_09231.p1  ORF type:complete len:180 (+),score=6.59 Phypoly_transcript_09231:844-1383(+)